MTLRRAWFLALPIAAGACAPAATTAGPGGAVAAAATDVVCPAGVSNAQTAFSREAEQSLLRATVVGEGARPPLFQTALTRAEAGVAADANNPLHHYLLGRAQLGLGNYEAAAASFARAEAICDAYGEETLPYRGQAFQTLYDQGLTAYQANDTATAISAWTRATQIYDRQPDPYFNLAILHTSRGDYDRALEFYNRTLTALDLPATDTSANAAVERADLRAKTLGGILNVGAQLHRAKNYAGAADVYARLTQLNPNNRDAWYNHALALYQLERWPALIPVAQRAVQIDPLNQNANIILFNALKNADRNNEALKVLEATDAMPVYVTDIQLDQQEGRTVARGTVEGNKARAGAPVQLELTFYGPEGVLGTQPVTVNAPAKGAKANFEATLVNPIPAVSYSYRLVR